MLLIYLPSNIIKIIHNDLDFHSQKNLRLTSEIFIKYPITNLSDNGANQKLTPEILKLYPHAIRLEVSYNEKISDVNYLTNLQILCAGGWSGINNNISSLTNLTKLDVFGNKNITDINHLINLQTLNASDSCGIGDYGISSLTNLTKLNTNYNKKITNIVHLTNLRILNATYSSGIDTNGITAIALIAGKLPGITDPNAKEFGLGSSPAGISTLTNLTELDIWGNNKITDIGHLINLRSLTTDGNSGININTIKQLTNLTKLNGCSTSDITDSNYKINLQLLNRGTNIL